MIPDKAFDLALEGGYSRVTLNDRKNWQKHALNPAFFQALGKALGWSGDWGISEYRGRDNVEGRLRRVNSPEYHAHRFCDLILTGGDTQKFWDELIN